MIDDSRTVAESPLRLGRQRQPLLRPRSQSPMRQQPASAELFSSPPRAHPAPGGQQVTPACARPARRSGRRRGATLHRTARRRRVSGRSLPRLAITDAYRYKLPTGFLAGTGATRARRGSAARRCQSGGKLRVNRPCARASLARAVPFTRHRWCHGWSVAPGMRRTPGSPASDSSSGRRGARRARREISRESHELDDATRASCAATTRRRRVDRRYPRVWQDPRVT
jgi:hypothetical protein